MARANGHSKTILDDMVGVGDFVLLDPVTEDAFLENLKLRFDANDIYVSKLAWSLPGIEGSEMPAELSPAPYLSIGIDW